jgi:hypothetical protein
MAIRFAPSTCVNGKMVDAAPEWVACAIPHPALPFTVIHGKELLTQ